MGYFKQGNLILKQTQKVQVQDVDISTDGSKVEVNSTVQADGLQIGTGPVITSISNSIASDSTAELMTSSAVEGAINDAVSAFSGSGGAEPLASIFNPREDVKSSRYNVASQDIADLTYDNITASATDNRFGVCALKSGLIALASRDTSATGITVEYYKENGDSVNSLSILTQYSSATLGPAAIKDMASTPSGKLISIFAIGTTERYLIAVNENCTDKIELQLPYDSVPYAYGVLPNDEVVMYVYNGSTYSMGIYKPDFDSSSFIAIKAFAVVTDGTGNGTPLEGPTIKFIGSNQVVVPSGNGAQIINLESHKYIASNEFTVSTSCLVENSNNIVTMIGATSTPNIYAKTFDFSGNDVTSEQIIVLSDKYDQGIPTIRLLPSGDFIVLYQGVGGYIRYIIFNSLLETLYEGITTIESNSLDCASDILPNGKLLIGSDAGSSVNISVLKFMSIPRKDLYLNDVAINDLQFETSINGESDSMPTSNVIKDVFGNCNDKVSPFSKNRYMSGSGIFGQGELDWEYSKTPSYLINIGNKLSADFSGSIITATMLNNNNLCIFHRTTTNNVDAIILDPTSLEVLNTETWTNGGTYSSLAFYRGVGAIKTWSGVVLNLFSNSTNGVLMGYHHEEGWFTELYSSSGQIKGYCVIDDDNILLFRYNNTLSRPEMAIYRADISTQTFIAVSAWAETTIPIGSTSNYDIRLTPLGNGKFFANTSNTAAIEFDLSGSYTTIDKTQFGVASSIGYCLDNRIILIGIDGDSKATVIILDKTYNVLNTISTEIDYTTFNISSYGHPQILSNGDITLTVHDYPNNNQPVAIFIKPNNDYQLTTGFKFISPSIASYVSNPIELQNGDVLYIDFDNVYTTYKIYGRQYKKVNKWTEKVEVLENLNRRNHGTYNQKVIKYQPQLVYKNTSPAGPYTRTLGYFNNGKLLIVDTAIYTGSYYHPHVSILDQNNNLTVNLNPITFDSALDLNQTITAVSDYAVLQFKNNPWCLFVVISTSPSVTRRIVIVDDNGNTVCEPFIPNGSSLTVGLLENDDIVIGDYATGSPPTGYHQGSNSYVSIWRVSNDSTALVSVQGPIAITLPTTGNGNYFNFDSNTFSEMSSGNLTMIDSKTLSSRANRLELLPEVTGANLFKHRYIPSLDGKHLYAGSWTYTGGVRYLYLAKFKYDRTNEEISFVDEVLLYSSSNLYTQTSQMYLFDTPFDYLIVLLHSLSESGVYKEGVIMLDRDMNQIQPDDYLYFGATEYYSSAVATISRNGELALLGVGATSYDTYVKKFKPVIEMTSPMNACLDVNYVTDTTSVTTINRKHIGQVIAYSSTTSHTIYVPSDSNDDLPLGFTCTLARLSSGDLTLAVDGGGVTISSISGNTSLRVAGSTVVLTKIDRNKWQLAGDLD